MKKSELKELYEMMFPDYPDVVNVPQLQQMLGIGRHTAYELIRSGEIKGLKMGTSLRIPKVYVIDYVISGGKEAI